MSNMKLILGVFLSIVMVVGLGTAYAQSDNDILQKWIDYAESYKDYMKEYKVWAYEKFSDYKDEIRELKSLNQNLTSVILDKDSEIIEVMNQQTRLGEIESGILKNIKIQKMQDIIDQQQKKIIYLVNKTSAYEIEENYVNQFSVTEIDELSACNDSNDALMSENMKQELRMFELRISESELGELRRQYNDLENENILLKHESEFCSDERNTISELQAKINQLRER